MDFPWVEEEEGGRVRDLLQLMVFAARPPRQRPRSRYLAVPQFAEKIVISNQPYNWFSTTAPLLPSGAVTFREPGRPHRAQLRAFDEVATDDNDVTHFTLLGGHAAANHATAVMHAVGELRIRGPWHSV